MNSLAQVEALTRAGRYGEALTALQASPREVPRDTDRDVLHAHLLERTGHYDKSRALAELLLSRTHTGKLHRSILETTLGVIRNDFGLGHLAIEHFQRAYSLAQSAGNLTQSCWTQLRLMLAIGDRIGPNAALPLLSQVRVNSQKLGDLHVSAALHIFLAEMEAKRGLLQNARRHVSLGLSLLAQEPNYWLEARAENVLVAVSIMRSDVASGLLHGKRALQLSETSGSGSLRRACLGNLGNLHFLLGNFKKAVECFTLAEQSLFTAGFCTNASLDGLAQIHLREGNLMAALSCIREIERTILSDEDWQLHPNRYAQLTRAELLLRQGHTGNAIAACDHVVSVSEKAGDHFLKGSALLLKALALSKAGKHSASVLILKAIDRHLLRLWPELEARYESALAHALLSAGERNSAARHYERGHRIFVGLENVPGALEVRRLATTDTAIVQDDDTENGGTKADVVQDIAALFSHIGRPELIADGVVGLLNETACVESARAVITDQDGTEKTIRSFDVSKAGDVVQIPDTVVQVGSTSERLVHVQWKSRNDLESIATLTAVRRLLDTASDLERAEADRQERQTIWPLPETSVDGDTFCGRKMGELIAEARRIASVNIGVLITGESGTGKEVLARTIHSFSPRCKKPFVPFNCTAVPREMLETQLFGHRRGAFTSADRDSLGLIRSTQGGTLFLDEVGELSLDLQPKLLRFLESGEIQPLGEATPISVDVRVIAATNANLEELVQGGRFREDLYYRLNIIRLIIPPLRERRDEIPALANHFASKAATEFGKGRIRIAEETMERLLLCDWPGNVRQLQNEIRRMVALADADSILSPSSLSTTGLRNGSAPTKSLSASGEMSIGLADKLTPTLLKIEREMIRVALTSHRGKVEDAAKSLGISRKGLYLKRRRLGI